MKNKESLMTHQNWVFWPMLMIVVQIFVLLFIAAQKRIKAVRANKIHYRTVQNLAHSEMPQDILLSGRSYDNQFQQPILFLILLILLQLHQVSNVLWVVSSWTYVIFRYWHCWEHITAINLKRRTYAFALSSILLLFSWLIFLVTQLLK